MGPPQVLQEIPAFSSTLPPQAARVSGLEHLLTTSSGLGACGAAPQLSSLPVCHVLSRIHLHRGVTSVAEGPGRALQWGHWSRQWPAWSTRPLLTASPTGLVIAWTWAPCMADNFIYVWKRTHCTILPFFQIFRIPNVSFRQVFGSRLLAWSGFLQRETGEFCSEKKAVGRKKECNIKNREDWKCSLFNW